MKIRRLEDYYMLRPNSSSMKVGRKGTWTSGMNGVYNYPEFKISQYFYEKDTIIKIYLAYECEALLQEEVFSVAFDGDKNIIKIPGTKRKSHKKMIWYLAESSYGKKYIIVSPDTSFFYDFKQISKLEGRLRWPKNN